MNDCKSLLANGRSIFPENTSLLAAEIARLMRDGSADSRKKASELLQSAMSGSATATKNEIDVPLQAASKGRHP